MRGCGRARRQETGDRSQKARLVVSDQLSAFSFQRSTGIPGEGRGLRPDVSG